MWNVYTQASAIPVVALSGSPDAVLNVNETTQLTAVLIPDNATNQILTWISSAPTIASVSNQGLVQGVNPGTAVITATTSDGTGIVATTTVEVRSPVAVPDDVLKNSNNVPVYPVPSHGIITIELESFSKPVSVTIYDMKGKLIHKTESTEAKINLNTNGLLKSGAYIIIVSDQKKSLKKKLLVN
jgi:uncharacterized protein YjdB